MSSVINLGLDDRKKVVASASILPAYLPWVDVLRFFACFLVIILHAVPSAPAGLGHAGVALFFSISGFLIGRVLIDNGDLSRFYSRRFLRIYPLYFVTLVLLGVLLLPPFTHNLAESHTYWKNIQYYLTFTFQLSPDSNHLPLMVVWSLCVEELFYLLLPIIFLLRRKILIGIVLATIVGVLLVPRFFLFPNGAAVWFLFPLNLFFGVFLALMNPKKRSWFPFIAIVAVSLLVTNAWMGWFQVFGPVSALLCTGTVWSLAVLDFRLPKLFEPLRWMGKLSYGMYLLHLFCLSAFIRILVKMPLHGIHVYLLVATTVASSAFASWIMQVCIENPSLKFRKTVQVYPQLRYLLATVQVSLIPIGVFLATLHRANF